MLPDGSIRRVETAARVIRDADGTPTELIGVEVGELLGQPLGPQGRLRQIAGLCSSAILQRQPWVVTDAAADPGTVVNPLVAGEFGLRCYAGVPAAPVGRSATCIGKLCKGDIGPASLLGSEPRLPLCSGAAPGSDRGAGLVPDLRASHR